MNANWELSFKQTHVLVANLKTQKPSIRKQENIKRFVEFSYLFTIKLTRLHAHKHRHTGSCSQRVLQWMQQKCKCWNNIDAECQWLGKIGNSQRRKEGQRFFLFVLVYSLFHYLAVFVCATDCLKAGWQAGRQCSLGRWFKIGHHESFQRILFLVCSSLFMFCFGFCYISVAASGSYLCLKTVFVCLLPRVSLCACMCELMHSLCSRKML